MNYLGQYTLPLIILFFVLFFFWINEDKPIKDKEDYSLNQTKNVAHFTLNVHIADLPDKYYEGGFYLYFDSPALLVKKLMAYQFDTGDTVSCKVNLQGRMINLSTLNKYLQTSSIYSRSQNIYNVKMVTIMGILEDGTTFSGMIDVDPEVDRNLYHNPILLESMKLEI